MSTSETEILASSNFTEEELALITSAVSKYINDDIVDPIRDSVLTKINNAVGRYKVIHNSLDTRIYGWSERNDIHFEWLTPEDVPVLKFLSCPKEINTSFVPSFSLAGRCSHAFSFSSPGVCRITSISNLINESPRDIILDPCELDLLFAFYTYHVLYERGALSDVIVSETSAEGEVEG